MERFLFGWHFLSRMNSLTVTEPLSDLELLEHWSKGDRKAGAVLFRRQQLCLRMFFTSKAGVDPKKFIEVVQASGFRSPYFDFKGKALLEAAKSLIAKHGKG